MNPLSLPLRVDIIMARGSLQEGVDNNSISANNPYTLITCAHMSELKSKPKGGDKFLFLFGKTFLIDMYK